MAIAELSEQLHGRLGFSHTTEVGDNTTGELYPDLTRFGIAPLSQAEWEAGEEVRLTGANSSKEEECLSI